MIEIKNVTKYFGAIRALNDVVINIKAGETYALLGKNGAGKTTLFRVIMGLIPPDIGKVIWDKHKITMSNLLKVGYVPEVRSLIPSLKVKQQVQYFSSIKGVSKAEFEKKWDLYAEILNLKQYSKTKIKNLSKGNQQKVQLVCGIIHDPTLIILDEPFSGLDVINRDLIGKVINLLKQQNKILIFSSHLIEDVEKFCESIIMIDNGSVIYQGSINKIKEEFSKYKVLEITFHDNDNEITFEKLNQIAKILQQNAGVSSVKVSANRLEIKTETVKQQDIIKTYMFKNFSSYITSLRLLLPSLNDIFIKKVWSSRNYDQNISLQKLSSLKNQEEDLKKIKINFEDKKNKNNFNSAN